MLAAAACCWLGSEPELCSPLGSAWFGVLFSEHWDLLQAPAPSSNRSVPPEQEPAQARLGLPGVLVTEESPEGIIQGAERCPARARRQEGCWMDGERTNAP